jgi:hypothetical protein
MPTAVQETIQVLEMIVQSVPIGTNLGLLCMLWAMLNGSFLNSRGAIFPALQANGFDEGQMRRSWSALRHGSWTIEKLIAVFRSHVLSEEKWQGHCYDGYRPLAVDWTTFWRPQLKGWKGKMYNGLANRALRGVGFGVMVDVGHVGGQRLPLLRHILRIDGEDVSENQLKKRTLQWVAQALKEDEIAILDAGVKVSQCQTADIQRFVLRLASNCTGRRNFLPKRNKRGRPREKGDIVRPLARTRKGNTIAASKPDLQLSFIWQEREIQVHGWQDLVLSDLKPDPDHDTFDIWVFFDPAYQDPLLLATNVALIPESVFALYLDRWPVEQVPLVAKQMIGLHRQFVFAPQSCLRLPELALLAGNILTYLAAVLPPMPTGFWDRHPKKRQAACAGSWLILIFSLSTKNMADFAKRTPSLSTYPRVWKATDAKNGILDPFPQYSLSLL